MSLTQSTLFCLLIASSMMTVLIGGAEGKPQSVYDIEQAPITAYKRFYSWEDAKRAASSEEGIRNKRKQFYAWAGKRSAAPVHFFEDSLAAQEAGPSMEKRKQFYAWAGK